MESRIILQANGRIGLPVELRRAAGLEAGDEIVIKLVEGKLVIYSRKQGPDLAVATLAPYLSKASSLAKELVNERRKASKDE